MPYRPTCTFAPENQRTYYALNTLQIKIKMANKTNNPKNFFETMLDAQQQVVDTMVEQTKKFSNGNTLLNDSIEKGTEFYRKSMDTVKDTVDKLSGQGETVKEEAARTTEHMSEFFSQWQKQQQDWAQKMTDMNREFIAGMMNPNTMQQHVQQMISNWNGMMNPSSMQNQWQQMMKPSSLQSQMDAATEQVKNFWNQFQNILNSNYSEFTKNFQNGTLMESYKGMLNMSDGFGKFYELWMPMMKAISDKTFNMDMFRSSIDLSKYKEFMDKYFSFMPQGTQEYMQGMNRMMTEMMKSGNGQMNELAAKMRASMEHMIPGMTGNPFSAMLTNYNGMYNQMMQAVSPFTKLMTPNADTKNMQEWNRILNDMNTYNIKSAEMQFMVYQSGANVMEKLAENLMHKIENGEEVNSMMKLYQEWLNISDAAYVQLFETDEYSALMAEVSALQLRIKKAVEVQMEKMFANVPVATRSEMDEMYKAIYELKKQVRQLQNMLDLEETTPEVAPKKSRSRKK